MQLRTVAAQGNLNIHCTIDVIIAQAVLHMRIYALG